MDQIISAGEFPDPVLRCHNCKKLVIVEKILTPQEKGQCVCGCRRFLRVEFLTDKEMMIIESEWPSFKEKFYADLDAGPTLAG